MSYHEFLISMFTVRFPMAVGKEIHGDNLTLNIDGHEGPSARSPVNMSSGAPSIDYPGELAVEPTPGISNDRHGRDDGDRRFTLPNAVERTGVPSSRSTSIMAVQLTWDGKAVQQATTSGDVGGSNT